MKTKLYRHPLCELLPVAGEDVIATSVGMESKGNGDFIPFTEL